MDGLVHPREDLMNVMPPERGGVQVFSPRACGGGGDGGYWLAAVHLTAKFVSVDLINVSCPSLCVCASSTPSDVDVWCTFLAMI